MALDATHRQVVYRLLPRERSIWLWIERTLNAECWHGSPAGCRRLDHADHSLRQSQLPDHDDRRESRRHDRRQAAAAVFEPALLQGSPLGRSAVVSLHCPLQSRPVVRFPEQAPGTLRCTGTGRVSAANAGSTSALSSWLAGNCGNLSGATSSRESFDKGCTASCQFRDGCGIRSPADLLRQLEWRELAGRSPSAFTAASSAPFDSCVTVSQGSKPRKRLLLAAGDLSSLSQ